MSRPPLVALVAGGRIRKSFLARIPSLAELLGPVASSSYRLASRIANVIRAGHPVAGCEGFDACRIVLIRVPDSRLAATLAQLDGAGLTWKGKTAILCETMLDSGSLEPLARAGARVASVDAIPLLDAPRFVVEGDRAAVRDARALFERHEARILELRPKSKSSYAAGLWAAAALFAPAMAVAAGCFKQAGIRSAPAATILAACVSRTLRTQRKTGRKTLRAPDIAAAIPDVIRADPELARHLHAVAGLFSSLSAGRRR